MPNQHKPLHMYPYRPASVTLTLSQLLKRTVDLENMVFSQGGHLMSNKKCKLPDVSFKRVRKGYEEIHVPAPKQKAVVEREIVPVSALPVWARCDVCCSCVRGVSGEGGCS